MDKTRRKSSPGARNVIKLFAAYCRWLGSSGSRAGSIEEEGRSGNIFNLQSALKSEKRA
jgi:hypothetical protein